MTIVRTSATISWQGAIVIKVTDPFRKNEAKMKATLSKSAKTPTPRLTDELLDCILVFRIRLIPVTDADHADRHIQALNVLPRSIAPLVHRATLAAKPWVHVESLLPFNDRWLVKSFLYLERPPHHHPIQYQWERVISVATARKDIAFLNWWHAEKFPIGSSLDPEQACENGNVPALDWALSAGLNVTFTQKAIQLAFRCGHVHILNWIIRNHKQSHPALAQAIRNADNIALAIAAGHTGVIRWWLARPFRTIARIIAAGQLVEEALSTVAPLLPSKQLEPNSYTVILPTLLGLLPTKLVTSIFLLSCASGNLESLSACVKRLSLASAAALNRNQRMTHLAYLYASAAGHKHVLEWLDHHDFVAITVISPATAPDACTRSLDRERLARARLRDPGAVHERLLSHFTPSASAWTKVHSAIDMASIMGHLDVLDWWLDMRDVMDSADFEYSALAINMACRQGNARIVEWWIESGLELKYSAASALAVPAALGHVDVLKVWRHSGIQGLKWNEVILIRAAQNGAVNVLEWWASEWSADIVRLAIDGCILTCKDVRVVEWYLENGGNQNKWTHRLNSWNNMISVEINLDFKSPADTSSDSLNSRPSPNSVAALLQEQELKKQIYLSYQRLCLRFPKLVLSPLSTTQLQALAERGCAAFIKLSLSKRPPTDGSIDIDELCHSDNCTSLIHWLLRSQSNLKAKYTHAAILNATKAGATRVLSWWAVYMPELTFKSSAELAACIKGKQLDSRTAQWWATHACRLSQAEASLWARPKPVFVPTEPMVTRKKLRPRTVSGSKSPAATASPAGNLTPLVEAMSLSTQSTTAVAAM